MSAIIVKHLCKQLTLSPVILSYNLSGGMPFLSAISDSISHFSRSFIIGIAFWKSFLIVGLALSASMANTCRTDSGTQDHWGSDHALVSTIAIAVTTVVLSALCFNTCGIAFGIWSVSSLASSNLLKGYIHLGLNTILLYLIHI